MSKITALIPNTPAAFLRLRHTSILKIGLTEFMTHPPTKQLWPNPKNLNDIQSKDCLTFSQHSVSGCYFVPSG